MHLIFCDLSRNVRHVLLATNFVEKKNMNAIKVMTWTYSLSFLHFQMIISLELTKQMFLLHSSIFIILEWSINFRFVISASHLFQQENMPISSVSINDISICLSSLSKQWVIAIGIFCRHTFYSRDYRQLGCSNALKHLRKKPLFRILSELSKTILGRWKKHNIFRWKLLGIPQWFPRNWEFA